MPQLDTTTYLAQITWLAITYITFYLLLTKYTLPSITKILYTRQYKAQQAQQAVQSPLHHESFHTQQHSLQHVQDACAQAKITLQNTMDDSQEWQLYVAEEMQHSETFSWQRLSKKSKKHDSFALEDDYQGMMSDFDFEGAHISSALKHSMDPAAQVACQMGTCFVKKTKTFQKATVRTLLGFQCFILLPTAIMPAIVPAAVEPAAVLSPTKVKPAGNKKGKKATPPVKPPKAKNPPKKG
jgi:hypothetical protein